MKLEQLTHSKCPNCKKHGISAFFNGEKPVRLRFVVNTAINSIRFLKLYGCL